MQVSRGCLFTGMGEKMGSLRVKQAVFARFVQGAFRGLPEPICSATGCSGRMSEYSSRKAPCKNQIEISGVKLT